jgi:hypothetical protein
MLAVWPYSRVCAVKPMPAQAMGFVLTSSHGSMIPRVRRAEYSCGVGGQRGGRAADLSQSKARCAGNAATSTLWLFRNLSVIHQTNANRKNQPQLCLQYALCFLLFWEAVLVWDRSA